MTTIIRHKQHIAHILTLGLIWLTILSLSTYAAASDWFVRPAGGNYGSEDGSSYQNAWDGLTSVVWGDSGVEAGDNLYVCGLHLWRETPHASSYRNWVIDANGTSDNRIIIRGDYPGDQGIIWGADTQAGLQREWSYEGDNVYSVITGNYYTFFFEDVSETEWTILTKVNSLQECKDTPGSYYAETYKYPDTHYFHCTDNGNPDGRIVGGINGWYICMGNREYITFKNIEFYVPKFQGAPINYIRFEGCKFWYHNSLGIIDTFHHIEFIDCDIAYAQGGIGIKDWYVPHGVDTPHHITVRGCKIHDIGVLPITQNGDAEGIGVNGCNDLTIEYNEFYNCGSGITLYPYQYQPNARTIIRYNYIHDMHQLGGARSMGVEFTYRASNVLEKPGNMCYGNIVTNTEDYAYKCTWATDQVVFYNNVAYNCGGSFYFNYTYTDYLGPNIVLKNNISLNPKDIENRFHIYFGCVSGEGNYVINSDNNLFYPDGGDLFAFKEDTFKTYTTNLSGWQSFSKSGCTFDPHSIIVDPLFVDPENGNFHLLPGSLAIDAGTDVGLAQDFMGNPIPLGSAPDIGAYEAVIDPDNLPPVLQAIGNKSVGEDVTLTFVVSATDPDNEPIKYLAQGLPNGATLDSQTGVFAWTPSYTQAGSYQVRFIASDNNSADSETITITVNNVNRPPVLGFIADPSVNENSLLSFSVNATDPDGQTIIYSVSGLPNGAVFASQNFTWTPSYDQAGTFAVTFTADDGQDQDSQVVTITVNNVNRAPVFTAIGNKSVWSDDPLTFTVDATDPDGDAVTYSANTVPSGATFITPTFNWTPSAAQIGSYDITFYASDGQLQDSEAITITVNVDSLAPTITNLSPAAGAIQVPLNNLITLNVTDAAKGINADSVKIKVRINSNPNNDTIYFGDMDHYISLLGDCRRVGSINNYTFVFQPTQNLFYYDQTITITVNATDLAGNVMDPYIYSFVTEMHLFGQNKLVSTNLGNNYRPVTVCDSSGNIWAAWHTGSAGSRDIYIGMLAAGADNFGSIIQLTNNENDQYNPALALDSNDKLYAVWQDNREGDWDIYMSTSVDGINWSTETRVNDPNDGNQVNPAIVIDSQSPNYAYVVWQDDRAGNQDICIASSSDGFITKTVSQITSDASDQVKPAIATDSANTIYVVWTDSRNGSSDIYGAASNNGPWTNVAIVSNASNQSSPVIAAESTGSILHLLWVDDAQGDNDIYYASSDGLPGSSLNGSSIIDELGSIQLDPTIALTGATANNDLKVFACWQDWRNTDTDLYFVELNAGSGTNVFVNDGGSNAYQSEPAMGIDEYGYPYLIWADERNTNTDIYYTGSTFIEPVALASGLVSASAPGSTIIGVDPQAITDVDDVSVILPAGACLYDVDISIVTILNQQVFSTPCYGSYDFGPSGIQFNQPVKIIIPYIYASSNGSTVPYWFNSLTGTLSQQGITNIRDIVISPTLHAISFETTHFTPFYLLGGSAAGTLSGGGGGGGGCSVSAGSEGNIVEFALPYIVLAVVMAILKMRDVRYRKIHIT